MGCSASSQARTVQTSPQLVQAGAQTTTNQVGSSAASPNVDHRKAAQIESTTSESVQEKNNQADDPRTGK